MIHPPNLIELAEQVGSSLVLKAQSDLRDLTEQAALFPIAHKKS